MRPTEVLPRVRPGREYSSLAVVLSHPALVFPLRLENAASSGRVLRAAVSPLDGQIDGQTAWAGVRLCGSGGALCTPPSVPSVTGGSVAPSPRWLCRPHWVPRGSVRSPGGSGPGGSLWCRFFLLVALPVSKFISFALTCSCIIN